MGAGSLMVVVRRESLFYETIQKTEDLLETLRLKGRRRYRCNCRSRHAWPGPEAFSHGGGQSQKDYERNRRPSFSEKEKKQRGSFGACQPIGLSLWEHTERRGRLGMVHRK